MTQDNIINLFLDEVILSQKLFESSYDSIFILHNGMFIDGNETALKKFNIADKAALAHLHPAQISPQYQADGVTSEEKATQMIQMSLDNGAHRFEWQHLTLDGVLFWAEVTLTKMTLQDKEVVYARVRDIDKIGRASCREKV